MSKNKVKQKIIAMILSAIMVVGMMPVLALAETGEPTMSASGKIIAFEELSADIANQSAPLGTSVADLSLPDTLAATVSLTTSKEEAMPNSGKSQWADTDDGSVKGLDVTSDEVDATSSEATKTEPEAILEESSIIISALLPVTWVSTPEYDNATAGTYIFSPQLPADTVLMDGVKPPVITVTVAGDVPPTLAGREMFTMFSTDNGQTQVLGLGTEEYPLRIKTAEQLVDFAWCLNNGMLPSTLPEQPHLLLVDDIDLSAYGARYDNGKGWMPIGSYYSRPFKGSFNGDGKTISGLYIDRSNTDYVGLFAYVRGGVVQNLTLQDVHITGQSRVGAVTGYIDGGRVQNCAVIGSIQGTNHVGGVVGVAASTTVQNCMVNGSISCSFIGTGGVAGSISSSTVQNCVVAGMVSGVNTVGGVAGWASSRSTMQNCIVTGSISGGIVGGIAGDASGSTVQGCAVLSSFIDPRTNIYYGRIASGYSSPTAPTLSGNYAWSGVKVKDSPVSDTNAGSIHGANVSFTDIQSLWTTGPLNNWDADLWTLSEGNLPVLTGLPGQSDALPPYIAGLAGTGASDDPYRIYTAHDFKWLADQINENEYFAYSKYFRLEEDIDLSAYGEEYDGGKGWTPIPFNNANFDGNGKTITGLYINRNNTNIGLFGLVTHGTIRNLYLEDFIIRSNAKIFETNIGGLAGSISSASIISGCAATGDVTGDGAVSNYVGGMVGSLKTGSKIADCMFSGTVSAKAEANINWPSSLPYAYAGGIAGLSADGTEVVSSMSIATVSAKGGTTYAGGIVGHARLNNGARITRSAALGANIISDNYIGRIAVGVIGIPTMDQNYAFSSMMVNGSTVSGTVGDNHGEDADAVAIQNLWATGALTAWDSDLWTLAKGKLPVLRGLSCQNDVLPAYITGLAGAGTSVDPYRVYTAEDLKWLADQVNAGMSFNSMYFRQENDISLLAYGQSYDGDKGWMPIGHTDLSPFSGNYDGNSKTINGLYINRSDTEDVGLFGVLKMATVQNLTLRSVSINAADCVGGIAGSAIQSRVQSCAVSGSIKGNTNVGGITGEAIDATHLVQNCTFANVQGDSSVGGIAGQAGDSVWVSDCLSMGSVSGRQMIGGMVGKAYNDCTILHCMSTVSLRGDDIGGIAGITEGTSKLQNCVALTATIDATGSAYGRVTSDPSSAQLIDNYAFASMKVNGSTVSGGREDNKDGASANTTLLLRAAFWKDMLTFNQASWSIAEGRLPYLRAFVGYAPSLGLTAYTFPASDSRDLILTANSTLLIKSPSTQTVSLTANGAFKSTAWPDLVWESSGGDLSPSADTFSTILTVPAGLTGSITVTAKLARFPSLPGKSVTIKINGDLEGTVNVSGTYRYGQTLTAISSVASPSPSMISYQWMRGSDPISGANNLSYELTEDDVGKLVSVRISAQNYADKIQSVGQTVLRRQNTTVPTAPQLEAKTQASIALRAIAGYEYAILTAGSDTALLGLTDAFQPDSVFTDLTAGTSYDLYQRIAETTTTEASKFSEKLMVTTDHTYTATVDPASKPFAPATVGYASQTAQQFTIQNTGSGTITGLDVLLAAASKFEISTALSDSTIVSGGIATVSVQPKLGLPIGTHNDTLLIKADKGVSLTVNLSFTVKESWDGSSDSDGDFGNTVTSPTPDQPQLPIQSEIKVDGTVDNGTARVNISAKTVTDAINKALSDATANKTKGIILVLKLSNGNKTVNNVIFNLPKVVQEIIIAQKVASIVLVADNPNIRIGMDLAAIREINYQANSDISITATRIESNSLAGNAKAAIGGRPVYELRAHDGNGKKVESFGTGRVSVAIPYTLGVNEYPGNVQAVYVDTNGKVQWLIHSVYDSFNNALSFCTSHFSTYGVGYKQGASIPTDISTHWAKDDIAFVVNRGLFGDTPKALFYPDTAMTRGMLVTALGRIAHADVSAYRQSSFTDVKSDSYYIEWAIKNNITTGVGDGKFAPEEAITREQTAVIISNYIKAIGLSLPNVYVENVFEDNAKISTYAKGSVKQMQMIGVLSGKKGNIFDPQGIATRAQVSTMLRRFVGLMISSDTTEGWRMNDSGEWMYFNNGRPVTGRKDINGSIYTFNHHGVTVDVPKDLKHSTYIVQKGDSFWLIAHKLGCTMSELEQINNKSRYDQIHPGDVLRVPEK